MKRIKQKEIEQLILDYIDCKMTGENESIFMDALKQDGYNIEDINDLNSLNKALEDFPIPDVSEKLDSNFYNMLEHYKYDEKLKNNWLIGIKESFRKFLIGKIAFRPIYILVIIIVSWIIGMYSFSGLPNNNKISNMSAEITQMKEVMMLSLLKQPSAIERIKAVNLTSELNEIDEKIIYALVKTLNSDPNINVRIVTIETLYHYADNPIVREELIKSITKQESPLVQIALADVMVALQEKKSVEEFNKLLQKKDLNDAARGKILKSIEFLI